MKMCPECAEEVKAAALVCRFCYHRFAQPAPAFTAAAAAPATVPPRLAGASRAALPPFPVQLIAGAVAAGVIATLVVVLALGVGPSHPTAVATDAADRAATAQARLAVNELESCWVVAQSYDGCARGVNVGLGRGRGQVELVRVAGDGYRLVARSTSGRTFSVRHRAGRQPVRTCAPAGRGGCDRDGRW